VCPIIVAPRSIGENISSMQVSPQTSTDRAYHEHNRKIPLADRVGYIARRKMFNQFMQVMKPGADSKILDIGVTDDIDSSAANMLEQLYPYRHNLTCAGITDGKAVETAYPGTRYVRITPGSPLPFSEQQFDIVYSNAVLEHVGSKEAQTRFVNEACRVGKKVFISVPNRLFPIEVHTGVPLLHLLPKPMFRALLRLFGFDFCAREENLNYIWAHELRSMYPRCKAAETVYSGVGIGPFRSNIISYSRKSSDRPELR
jgi:SAM-dependent methyltransferase